MAIIELGNLAESAECFARFKEYKTTTGSRVLSGMDANPEEIKRVKHEGQAFAKDIGEILRKRPDPFNSGLVDAMNIEENRTKKPRPQPTHGAAPSFGTKARRHAIDFVKDSQAKKKQETQALGPMAATRQLHGNNAGAAAGAGVSPFQDRAAAAST
eukprot:g9106.t1